MALAALLLTGVYVGMRFGINGHSDSVFSTLQGFDVKEANLNLTLPKARKRG